MMSTKVRSLRVIAAISSVVAIAPGAAQANTLADLYQLAAQNDLTLQVALHQRDAGLEAGPRARASLFPQIAAQANYRQNQLHVSSVNTGSNFTPIDESYVTSSYSLTLSQTLFDWSAFANLSAADKLESQARAAYISAEQNLILRLVNAYFQVLSAEDTLRADQDAQAAFKQQLDQMQDKFRSGVSPVTDVKNAQAAYDTSTATVIADVTAVSSAKRALAIIVGQPIDQVARLREEIALVPPSPASVESWATAAAQDNPSVVPARFAAEAAKQQISVSRGRHLPTVAAIGSIGQDNSDSRFGNDNESNYIGVSLSLPIFQGGQVSTLVNQAEASYLQALAQYQLQVRTADQNVRNDYEGVVNGIATVKASASAVSSQQNSVIATEVGFKVGIRTVIDVLSARQSLASAQKSFSFARYRYLISLLSLKNDVGQLSRRDIDDIDRLLIGASVAPARGPAQ